MLAKNQSLPKQNKESIWLKTPSKKLVDFVLIFRVGIAIAALLSLLLAGGCQMSWTQDNSEVVKGAIADNTYITSLYRDLAKTSTLDAELELVLIDYRNQNICGLQGCLYNLYLHGDKIWSKYLQPDLPPKIDLFALNHEIKNELPCLDVKQYSHRNLLSMTYCYDGETYALNESFYE